MCVNLSVSCEWWVFQLKMMEEGQGRERVFHSLEEQRTVVCLGQ